MAVYEYDSQNQELKRIAGGTLYASIPIGSYIPFGGTAIPTGWLLCNGQAVSRTDYADLFAVIGTAYGSGDGSTTFNIPDLREAVPKGAGLTSKSNNHLDADGLAVGEFIDDRIQNIKLDPTTNARMSVWRDGSPVLANSPFTYNDTSYSSATPASVGVFSDLGFDASKNVRAGATTEVKAVGSNYIIKAKQIGVPADFASAIEDVVDDSIINITGTFTVNLSPNGYDNITVNFPASLPNSNYVLSFQAVSTGSILFTVMHRYNTGAVVNVRNLNDATLAVDCNWFLICKK